MFPTINVQIFFVRRYKLKWSEFKVTWLIRTGIINTWNQDFLVDIPWYHSCDILLVHRYSNGRCFAEVDYCIHGIFSWYHRRRSSNISHIVPMRPIGHPLARDFCGRRIHLEDTICLGRRRFHQPTAYAGYDTDLRAVWCTTVSCTLPGQ